MWNPYVPAVHLNLRYLSTSRAWFGGGSDLTPTFPFTEDTEAFHAALRRACDSYRPDAYREFKAWCDEYFYLPHRQEPRGVGGIFFDDLASRDPQADFAFVRSVGEALLQVFPLIVARRKDTPFDEAARERLLVKRGRRSGRVSQLTGLAQNRASGWAVAVRQCSPRTAAIASSVSPEGCQRRFKCL